MLAPMSIGNAIRYTSRRATASARLAIGLAMCLLAAGVTRADDEVDQDTGLAQFGVQRWTTADGLDGNWVRGIAHAADGSLWVATSTGVSRFDGRTFARLDFGDDELSSQSISALALTRDGHIVVGTQYAGVVDAALMPDLVAEATRRLTGMVVHDLVERDAEAGELWVGTDRGLWVIDREHPDGLQVAPDTGTGDTLVRTVVRGMDGTIWARTESEGLWRIDGRDAARVPDVPDCLGYGVAVGADAERYVSCRRGVWRWQPQRGVWEAISDAYGVGRIHLDRRGDLWFGTPKGLVRWSMGRSELLPADRGLGDWRVRAIAEDARGDLWFGTFSGGLARLTRGAVRSYGVPEGLNVDSTTAVLADGEGGVWLGSLAGGLRRFHFGRGPGPQWGPSEGLPGVTAWALAHDPRRPGAVWVGADAGLAWLSGGKLHPAGPAGEQYAGIVHIVYPDPADPETLWLSGTDGAVALRGPGRIVHDRARGLPVGRVRAFLRDRSGRMLAGGAEGLYAFDGERWTAWTAGGNRIDAVTALAEDADGRLWVASERRGLMALTDDSTHVLGRAAGLPFSPVHSIAFDTLGGVWLSGNDGLARFRISDHARWVAGEASAVPFERIGRRDGLRDLECNGWGAPSLSTLPDGRFVYPTIAGLGVVNAAELPSVGLAPTEIYLREAWAGTRRLGPSMPMILAPPERSLRLAFSAVELLRPEAVAFRYRLVGVDADWVSAGAAREAAWSPLPPGSFRFELQARLPGQPWVDAARPAQITVQPQPWESPMVRIVAIALVLLLAYAAVHWRIDVERAHTRVIAHARRFLREVIDSSPNPIFVRDRDGAYRLVNRAAAAIYGNMPDAIEGRKPADFGRTTAGMAAIEALDAAVIATGSEQSIAEHAINDVNGRTRWFRVVKRPGVGTGARAADYVVGSAVDVTDFKLAREELEAERDQLRRSREQARALSRQLLRAQEDERRRLAREIHDDVSQQLAGLSMLAWSTAQASAAAPGVDRHVALEELAHGLERVARSMQTLSRELHPPALDALGLSAALRAECASFAGRTGIDVRYEETGACAEPAADVALALYRISQEALRNALNHAHAATVIVHLHGGPDALELCIADDGVGFDPGARSAEGIGLSSMRERARLAGVRLDIESGCGAGTRIRAILKADADACAPTRVHALDGPA
jgi:PAS domain S-box-containing protein